MASIRKNHTPSMHRDTYGTLQNVTLTVKIDPGDLKNPPAQCAAPVVKGGIFRALNKPLFALYPEGEKEGLGRFIPDSSQTFPMYCPDNRQA